MYEFIEGILITIQPTYVVVNANGIGYRINSANPFSFQDKLQQEIRIYVEQVVRDDSMTLYGFIDENEKTLFLTLNKVSGIGPKSAMSILAAQDHDGLINAIEQGDSKYLMKFPGVGKKTAQQMILDLKGELSLPNEVIQEQTVLNNPKSKINEEVLEALVGLGYSQREINRVEKEIQGETFTSAQEGLSLAFKLLLKN